jgi:hypothetical protein
LALSPFGDLSVTVEYNGSYVRLCGEKHVKAVGGASGCVTLIGVLCTLRTQSHDPYATPLLHQSIIIIISRFICNSVTTVPSRARRLSEGGRSLVLSSLHSAHANLTLDQYAPSVSTQFRRAPAAFLKAPPLPAQLPFRLSCADAQRAEPKHCALAGHCCVTIVGSATALVTFICVFLGVPS